MGKRIVMIDRAGRITIPSDVRKELELKEGDLLKVEVKEGKITLIPLILKERRFTTVAK